MKDHLLPRTWILWLAFLAISLWGLPADASQFSVPILLYHRFAPTSPNAFTVTLKEFEGQMSYLKEKGYQVIPLRSLVDYYLGKGSPPPARAVVITIDDGHASIYQYAFPLLKKYGFPATLFIYPCCIEHVNYALTWAQIREMANQGLEIGSHTRYHPNFKVERRRLSPEAYEELVTREFTSSKRILEEKLQRPIDFLSYPFGLHDEILEKKGFEAGYLAMFTLARQPCEPESNRGALGRYLITPHTSLHSFASILSSSGRPRTARSSDPSP